MDLTLGQPNLFRRPCIGKVLMTERVQVKARRNKIKLSLRIWKDHVHVLELLHLLLLMAQYLD